MKLKIAIVIFISPLFLFACGERKSSAEIQNTAALIAEDAVVKIKFDTIVNDMGTIAEGEKVIAWFDYVNSGNSPLIIYKINAGCGCTVPEWNTAPLAPGGRESVKVIFDSSGKKGFQDIRISVQSNAKTIKDELRIKAIVKSIN